MVSCYQNCSRKIYFLTFPAGFWIPIISNLLNLRKVHEQVKKAFYSWKFFWPFTVWTNCSSDLKIFANSPPSALNFKKCSRSLEHFFLTVHRTILVSKYYCQIATVLNVISSAIAKLEMGNTSIFKCYFFAIWIPSGNLNGKFPSANGKKNPLKIWELEKRTSFWP